MKTITEHDILSAPYSHTSNLAIDLDKAVADGWVLVQLVATPSDGLHALITREKSVDEVAG